VDLLNYESCLKIERRVRRKSQIHKQKTGTRNDVIEHAIKSSELSYLLHPPPKKRKGKNRGENRNSR